MRRLPPVGSMQAFVEVARLGSLKAAAEQLALSSPALTRRIQSLEQFVGLPLFDRAHNGIQLNARGESFFAEIAPHIDAMALSVERISDPARGLRLRIAVPSLFASQRLMPALPSLRAEHPNLLIDVDTGANRLARLGDDVDAVITIAADVDDRYYSRLLERGRVITVGSQALREGKNPVRRPADLERMPILLHRDMPGAFDEWRREIGLPGLTPASITHYDAGQLILDAAAEGLGVAFMHDSHIAHSHDGRLVQMFEETVQSPYSYWFVCQPEALKRRPLKAFHDWLFARFAGSPRTGEQDGVAPINERHAASYTI
ncbi:MAG: LysR substrate-binding domain-containing protein [Sphingomicrobium sp.]